jgi:FkbM family methyltransferase
MKNETQTLLDIVHHIATSHPELRPSLEQLIFGARKNILFDANFLLRLNESLLRNSRSQLRQDLFVLSELNYKRNGYFVEFGATNGLDLSNTHLLETQYDWTGILAEPATRWHADLDKNRAAKIDKRCIWRCSGESLVFNETDSPEFSTIDCFSSSDGHAKARESGKKYSVETVSLMDLLIEHKAPRVVDYLSIDTEGSEFDILENFDFESYKFKIITCEHNYTPMREKLSALLQNNGYQRKYEDISQFDDWWVLSKA